MYNLLSYKTNKEQPSTHSHLIHDAEGLKPHRVRLIVQPAVKMLGTFIIKVDDPAFGTPILTVKAFSERDEFGTEYQAGLDIRVEILAPDLEIAIERSQNIAHFLVGMIAFLTSAALSPPVITLAYEADSKASIHRMVVFKDAPLGMQSRRQVGKDDLKQLVEQFSSVLDDEVRHTVQTALRWHLRALNEHDIVQRFLFHWISLEELEPALKQLYESRNLQKKVKDKSYLKILLNEAYPNHHLYTEANRLRNMLVHPKKKTQRYILQAKEMCNPLLQIFVYAITKLLRYQPEHTTSPTPIHPSDIPRVEIILELEKFHPPSPGKEDNIVVPEILFKKDASKLDDGARLSEDITMRGPTTFGKGVKVRKLTTKVIGEEIEAKPKQ